MHGKATTAAYLPMGKLEVENLIPLLDMVLIRVRLIYKIQQSEVYKHRKSRALGTKVLTGGVLTRRKKEKKNG